MAPPAAQRFVRQSGARFLLASCDAHADLRRWLGSLIVAHAPVRLRGRLRLVVPAADRAVRSRPQRAHGV